MTQDYYDVLGVSDAATPEEIRRAYRDLAKVAMADRPRFERISKAFETLKDASRRAAYDRQRGLGVLPDDDEEGASAGGSSAAGASMNSTLHTQNFDGPTVALTPNASGSGGGSTMMSSPTVAIASPGATIGFGGATAQLALPPCPVCRTPSVPGEEFCLECGFRIGSTPGAANNENPLPRLFDEAGREFPLRTGENIIGREGADVMLPDKSVSRRHAVIQVEGNGAVYATDLGSTNGTKAAGQRLAPNQRITLYDGAPLRFGAVKMTITIPAAPAPEAIAALPAPAEGDRTRQPIAALGAGLAPDRTMSASAARLIAGDGKVFVLSSTNVTVGRKPENTIVLTGDSYISGSHARIVFEADGFTVVDVGSTNGTRVNGRRLEPNIPHPLAEGDEVVFGQTALTFRAPSIG